MRPWNMTKRKATPSWTSPTVMSWWQETENTAWLNAKHLDSKPSSRVTQIKVKLTTDSSHAYYAHPDSHSDADIVCILNSQIPPLSAPDVCCYVNPRVMFWTEHLLAYADVKKHTKAMNYFTSLFMVLSSALLREAEESSPLASKGF